MNASGVSITRLDVVVLADLNSRSLASHDLLMSIVLFSKSIFDLVNPAISEYLAPSI